MYNAWSEASSGSYPQIWEWLYTGLYTEQVFVLTAVVRYGRREDSRFASNGLWSTIHLNLAWMVLHENVRIVQSLDRHGTMTLPPRDTAQLVPEASMPAGTQSTPAAYQRRGCLLLTREVGSVS